MTDSVDLLIRDFQARSWASEPFERALAICSEQPHEIARLGAYFARVAPERVVDAVIPPPQVRIAELLAVLLKPCVEHPISVSKKPEEPVMNRVIAGLFACAAVTVFAVGGHAADKKGKKSMWVATPLTEEGAFTPGIEGPAVDREGNVYAVNYAKQGTIGRTTPDGKSEVYVTLPEGSVGNGIRFDRDGTMYIADYPKHNVLRVDPKTKQVSVFAHEPTMNQPNDLAIAPNGTLYASDPAWDKGTGQLWRIDRNGKVTRVAADMGTTNGIEVSPDGKTLYVNESVQRNIWAFDIQPDGSLTGKRLLIQFPDHGFDGMRADVEGNLYVTRYGKGTVAVVSPKGKVLREIDVLGKQPSNLCFGGPDGRTCYVTEVEHTRLVQFRTDKPGLEWKRWQRR